MAVYRIGKQVLLLWVFVWCAKVIYWLGPGPGYLYSNTLQSIAGGYLIASCYSACKDTGTDRYASGISLLIFWERWSFITVGNAPTRTYQGRFVHRIVIWPNGSIAPYWDVSGMKRVTENGKLIFATWYRYTWILSSLNFATVLTAVRRIYPKEQIIFRAAQIRMLFGTISGYGYAGWLWGIELPLLRNCELIRLMVLVSSGTVSCL